MEIKITSDSICRFHHLKKDIFRNTIKWAGGKLRSLQKSYCYFVLSKNCRNLSTP